MHPFFSKRLQVDLAALVGGLLLAFYLSNAGAAPSPATLPDIQQLLKEGRLPQALDQVGTYLSTRPKDAPGRFLKGVILTEMGRPSDAIDIFGALTEDFPQLPEPYNNLAVLYAQQKQYDKARVALEMAIKTHPSYSVAHENLGDIYAKLASQSYDRALQRDSSHAVAPSQLSLIRALASSAPQVQHLANARSYSAQATPKPASGKVSAPEAAQKSPKASAALDSSSSDSGVSTLLQHWSSAWARMDFKGAIAYFISDLTCRALREKISSPSLVAGSTGSSGATGCRSELRKSRFW
jgi:tetratricopeptide (TPR) repeat protein